MARQMAIMRLSDSELIGRLLEALRQYGRHSLYCGWDRLGGRYRPELGCTCGLAEILEEAERHVREG